VRLHAGETIHLGATYVPGRGFKLTIGAHGASSHTTWIRHPGAQRDSSEIIAESPNHGNVLPLTGWIGTPPVWISPWQNPTIRVVMHGPLGQFMNPGAYHSGFAVCVNPNDPTVSCYWGG
jgi:hypothetical protein